MSAAWMVYASCVGVLLALAGKVLEQPLRQRSGAARGAWFLLLFAALLWPAEVALVGPVTVVGATRVSQPVAAMPLPAPPLRGGGPAPVFSLPDLVPAAPIINLTASRVATVAPLIGLLVFALEIVRLARARRRWRAAVIDGVPVLLSVNFGPAIVGVLRPQIVIPEWAMALSTEQRALMLAHESEHLVAHDSRWLALAYCAVLIAPWNIGLWWLLRRVRLAVEVDCDRRVLQGGTDLEQYGNLLIGIGRHGASGSLLVAGFAERRSFLRARIDRMTVDVGSGGSRHVWRLALGASLVLAACALGPSYGKQAVAESIPFLQSSVGDSIVNAGGKPHAIKAAQALPIVFRLPTTVTQATAHVGMRCPATLVDARDNTVLTREAEQQFFTPGVKGTTPSGKVASVVGYYRVHPVGRYGVDSTQWLRVGCDLPTPRSILGDEIETEANFDRHAIIPSGVQEMLKHLPPPTDGKPHISSKFLRETAFRGEGVGLVTATWFPRVLREQLRHMPVITTPKLSGAAATAEPQPLPVWAGARAVGGEMFDLYVTWQIVATSVGGRVEASPALLTYQAPGMSLASMLAPNAGTVVRSETQVLVVRP